MKSIRAIITVALVIGLGVAPFGGAVQAQESPSIVTDADLGAALGVRSEQLRSARQSVIRTLKRADVQALAAGLGVDMRDAESAVYTLDGADLQIASSHAAAMEAALSGGASSVTISLVAALLIVIIIILLV
jgi:hypothetical protein